MRTLDLYRWRKLRLALDSSDLGDIDPALVNELDETTCKNQSIDDVTENLINLSLDDITLPPSRRLSKAQEEFLGTASERVLVSRQKLEEALQGKTSRVPVINPPKMKPSQTQAEKDKLEKETAERKKAEDLAKINVSQVPPGMGTGKISSQVKGKTVAKPEPAKSILKFKSKDSSEGSIFHPLKLPRLAIKIEGETCNEVLKMIPEEKEVFEFTGKSVFDTLCMKLQENLLMGPDTFPGYWRNGEKIYGSQFPEISHLKRKPTFDLHIYKKYIKQRRVERVIMHGYENSKIKMNAFSSYLTLRDRRIDKPEWSKKFVEQNKMVITFGYVIRNNEPAEERRVVFRNVVKYPENAWRMNCLCVYCRWKKYKLGYHVPHSLRPEGSREPMVHPGHLQVPPKISICWGMREWNKCTSMHELKMFEEKSYGIEDTRGTRTCPCCRDALRDYVLVGEDWLEDADL